MPQSPEKQKKPIGPDLSTIDEELRRLYAPAREGDPQYEKIWGEGILGAPTLPEVVTPPMFWRDKPGMLTPTNLSKLIEEYSRISPETMAGVSRIATTQTDPFWSYYDSLERELISPWGLHLPGPKGTGDIWINPALASRHRPSSLVELESTLAHELGHQAGYPDRTRAIYNIEGLGRMRGEAKKLWREGKR